MATSMFSFLFTGAVGTTIYARKRVQLSATVGYLIYGEVGVMLGVLCGLITMVLVLAGASLAHWLPATRRRCSDPCWPHDRGRTADGLTRSTIGHWVKARGERCAVR